MSQPVNQIRSFEVRVGHMSVTVESASVDQAIEVARKKLSLQMPRLWDVIEKLEPHRFEVAAIS